MGLSILSGSHLELVPDILRGMKEAGLDDVPVVVGGIVPDADASRLREMGVAAVRPTSRRCRRSTTSRWSWRAGL